MALVSDIMLFSATLFAALYCYILSRRLKKFTTLESGMGGAIAVLSAQVDEMTTALANAQSVAGGAELRLVELSNRAEGLAVKLELMVAALHDLPDNAAQPGKTDNLKVEPVSSTASHGAETDEQFRPRVLRRRHSRFSYEALQ